MYFPGINHEPGIYQNSDQSFNQAFTGVKYFHAGSPQFAGSPNGLLASRTTLDAWWFGLSIIAMHGQHSDDFSLGNYNIG